MTTRRLSQPLSLPSSASLLHRVLGAARRRSLSPQRVWREVKQRSGRAAQRVAWRWRRDALLPQGGKPHPERCRHEFFPATGAQAWLDGDEALDRVRDRLHGGTLSVADAANCHQFNLHGYVIVPNALPHAWLDATWERYERAIRHGHTPLPPPSFPVSAGTEWARLLNAHHFVPALARLLRAPVLQTWLQLLLGQPCSLVQSIASLYGREPPLHSDAVHVSSHPLGHVIGASIAFEDGTIEAGPLRIYPGSHRMPYVMSHHAGISPEEGQRDWVTAYRTKYEPFMQKQLGAYAERVQHYVPRKGDVLLYHHNLLHEGSPATDLTRTRRSLVAHYVAQGAVAYHDLSGRLLRA